MPANLSNKEITALLSFVETSDQTKIPEVDKICKKLYRACKPIKVQSAKDKGRGLQYWVCEKIAAVLHVTFVQSDDLCPVHSREMGQPGCDIVLRTAEAQRKFPYTVECKSTESFELMKTIEQVRANQKDGTDWLIVHKRKALTEPIVLMDWSAFERLFRSSR